MFGLADHDGQPIIKYYDIIYYWTGEVLEIKSQSTPVTSSFK